MKYAKVIKEFRVYEPVKGCKTVLKEKFLGVKGELLTEGEVKKNGVPESAIEWVDVKRTETYWFFGSRFDMNDRENPVKIEDGYWRA